MDGELKIPQTEELNKKGSALYEELKSKLEPTENGRYIAIEVESSEYAVGEDTETAISELRKKYPEKLFYVRRIGELTKISLRLPDVHHAELL